MAGVALVVPWRSGCPHRERAWEWVRGRLVEQHPGWDLVVGDGGTGPWRKGVAVAQALELTDAELLVVVDADIWTELGPAVRAVERGARWAIPHSRVHRLTAEASAEVLAGGPLAGDLEEAPYRGVAGGGAVVLHRSAWEQVPIDPRFAGWGGEDEAWAHALRRVVGRPVRLSARLWHLWHPPQERQSRRWGAPASQQLRTRYLQARRPADVLEILAEVRPPVTIADQGER